MREHYIWTEDELKDTITVWRSIDINLRDNLLETFVLGYFIQLVLSLSRLPLKLTKYVGLCYLLTRVHSSLSFLKE